jgi:ElaB/YqjD/DUF883 family membrane-anchored ribosome-binding protein
MSTLEKASDYAHEAGDKIASATNQAAKALGDKGEQLLNAEQKMMKHCCNYVTDHPMKSLGMAVAFGYMLRRLLSSR